MTEIKQSNHHAIVPIGMNQYLIIEGNDKRPVFRFDNIISCSAIIFKCQKGFAGFHYAAGGLKNDCEKYARAMVEMINDIKFKIGDILWVKCFTPSPQLDCFGVQDCSDDEESRISSFFLDHIKVRCYRRVYHIGEVSHSIEWEKDYFD